MHTQHYTRAHTRSQRDVHDGNRNNADAKETYDTYKLPDKTVESALDLPILLNVGTLERTFAAPPIVIRSRYRQPLLY